jgi:hypothetical protein
MSEINEFGPTMETVDRPASYKVYSKLWKPKYLVPYVFLFLSDVASFADKKLSKPPKLRQLLPEPFDYFDHAGVFVSSMNAAMFSTCIVAKLSTMAAGLGRERHHRTIENVARGVGIAAVFGQSVLTETRWGASYLGSDIKTTTDTIDFMYAMGAGVFAASLIGIRATNQEAGQPTA